MRFPAGPWHLYDIWSEMRRPTVTARSNLNWRVIIGYVARPSAQVDYSLLTPGFSTQEPSASVDDLAPAPGPAKQTLVAGTELPVDRLVDLVTPADAGDELPPAPTWGA